MDRIADYRRFLHDNEKRYMRHTDRGYRHAPNTDSSTTNGNLSASEIGREVIKKCGKAARYCRAQSIQVYKTLSSEPKGDTKKGKTRDVNSGNNYILQSPSTPDNEGSGLRATPRRSQNENEDSNISISKSNYSRPKFSMDFNLPPLVMPVPGPPLWPCTPIPQKSPPQQRHMESQTNEPFPPPPPPEMAGPSQPVVNPNSIASPIVHTNTQKTQDVPQAQCCFGMYPLPVPCTQNIDKMQYICHPKQGEQNTGCSCSPANSLETCFKKCEDFCQSRHCTKDERSMDRPKNTADDCRSNDKKERQQTREKDMSKCCIEKALCRKLLRMMLGWGTPIDCANEERKECSQRETCPSLFECQETEIPSKKYFKQYRSFNDHAVPLPDYYDSPPKKTYKIQQRFLADNDAERIWLEQYIPVLSEVQPNCCSEFRNKETKGKNCDNKQVGTQYPDYKEMCCIQESLENVKICKNETVSVQQCKPNKCKTIQFSIKNHKKNSKPINLNLDINELLRVAGTDPAFKTTPTCYSNCCQLGGRTTQSTQCSNPFREVIEPCCCRYVGSNPCDAIKPCHCMECVTCDFNDHPYFCQHEGCLYCTNVNGKQLPSRRSCVDSYIYPQRLMRCNRAPRDMIYLSPWSRRNGASTKRHENICHQWDMECDDPCYDVSGYCQCSRIFNGPAFQPMRTKSERNNSGSFVGPQVAHDTPRVGMNKTACVERGGNNALGQKIRKGSMEPTAEVNFQQKKNYETNPVDVAQYMKRNGHQTSTGLSKESCIAKNRFHPKNASHVKNELPMYAERSSTFTGKRCLDSSNRYKEIVKEIRSNEPHMKRSNTFVKENGHSFSRNTVLSNAKRYSAGAFKALDENESRKRSFVIEDDDGGCYSARNNTSNKVETSLPTSSQLSLSSNKYYNNVSNTKSDGEINPTNKSIRLKRSNNTNMGISDTSSCSDTYEILPSLDQDYSRSWEDGKKDVNFLKLNARVCDEVCQNNDTVTIDSAVKRVLSAKLESNFKDKEGNIDVADDEFESPTLSVSKSFDTDSSSTHIGKQAEQVGERKLGKALSNIYDISFQGQMAKCYSFASDTVKVETDGNNIIYNANVYSDIYTEDQRHKISDGPPSDRAISSPRGIDQPQAQSDLNMFETNVLNMNDAKKNHRPRSFFYHGRPIVEKNIVKSDPIDIHMNDVSRSEDASTSSAKAAAMKRDKITRLSKKHEDLRPYSEAITQGDNDIKHDLKHSPGTHFRCAQNPSYIGEKTIFKQSSSCNGDSEMIGEKHKATINCTQNSHRLLEKQLKSDALETRKPVLYLVVNQDPKQTKLQNNDFALSLSKSVTNSLCCQSKEAKNLEYVSTEFLLKNPENAFEERRRPCEIVESHCIPEGNLTLSSITLSSEINDIIDDDIVTVASNDTENVSCFSDLEMGRWNNAVSEPLCQLHVDDHCAEKEDLDQSIYCCSEKNSSETSCQQIDDKITTEDRSSSTQNSSYDKTYCPIHAYLPRTAVSDNAYKPFTPSTNNVPCAECPRKLSPHDRFAPKSKAPNKDSGEFPCGACPSEKKRKGKNARPGSCIKIPQYPCRVCPSESENERQKVKSSGSCIKIPQHPCRVCPSESENERQKNKSYGSCIKIPQYPYRVCPSESENERQKIKSPGPCIKIPQYPCRVCPSESENERQKNKSCGSYIKITHYPCRVCPSESENERQKNKSSGPCIKIPQYPCRVCPSESENERQKNKSSGPCIKIPQYPCRVCPSESENERQKNKSYGPCIKISQYPCRVCPSEIENERQKNKSYGPCIKIPQYPCRVCPSESENERQKNKSYGPCIKIPQYPCRVCPSESENERQKSKSYGPCIKIPQYPCRVCPSESENERQKNKSYGPCIKIPQYPCRLCPSESENERQKSKSYGPCIKIPQYPCRVCPSESKSRSKKGRNASPCPSCRPRDSLPVCKSRCSESCDSYSCVCSPSQSECTSIKNSQSERDTCSQKSQECGPCQRANLRGKQCKNLEKLCKESDVCRDWCRCSMCCKYYFSCGEQDSICKRKNKCNRVEEKCAPCVKQRKCKAGKLEESTTCRSIEKRDNKIETLKSPCKTKRIKAHSNDDEDKYPASKETCACVGVSTASSFHDFEEIGLVGNEACCFKKCRPCSKCDKSRNKCANMKFMDNRKTKKRCDEDQRRACVYCGLCRDAETVPFCTCICRKEQMKMYLEWLTKQKRGISKRGTMAYCNTNAQPKCDRFFKEYPCMPDRLPFVGGTNIERLLRDNWQPHSSFSCQCCSASDEQSKSTYERHTKYEPCPSKPKKHKSTKEFFRSINHRCLLLRNMLASINPHVKSKAATNKAKSLLHIHILKKPTKTSKSFEIEMRNKDIIRL